MYTFPFLPSGIHHFSHSSSQTLITMFRLTAWPLPKSHFSISSVKPNFMLFLPGIIRTHLFLSIQLNVLIKPLSHNIINPTTFFCTALINAILFKFYPFKVSSVIIFFTFFVHNRSIFAVLSSAYCFYRKQNYVYF